MATRIEVKASIEFEELSSPKGMLDVVCLALGEMNETLNTYEEDDDKLTYSNARHKLQKTATIEAVVDYVYNNETTPVDLRNYCTELKDKISYLRDRIKSLTSASAKIEMIYESLALKEVC